MNHNGQDDLEITRMHWESEGREKGYVFFNDGSRVGFAPLKEVAIWDAGGDKWSSASARHLVMAHEYLEAQGIEFPPVSTGRKRQKMSTIVQVTFKTPNALSQEVGADFWTTARHFKAVTGRTYEVTFTFHSEKLEKAVESAVARVFEVTDKFGVDSDQVVVTKIVGHKE